VELGDDQRQADTVILLEYYRLPSVVVKKHRLRQEWVFQDDNWRIKSTFPNLP
jgi:hypothetical protein